MAKNTGKKQDLGSCPFCGESLIETKVGWGCSNFRGGCKAFLFKNDRFFEKVLGLKLSKANALKLIMGGSVEYKDVVIKGKKRSISLTWGKKEGEKYPFGYTMEFLDSEV